MTGADFTDDNATGADLTGANPTGDDFNGVDIDLLADYIGGALAGTPDESRVAALIADEPAWRDAHALLSEGMATVGDSLQAWGAAAEPMPADVVARLDAALGEPGGVAVASGPGAAAVRSNVVDLQSRRRRRVRMGGSFAAAAAVLAVAGVGIAYLSSGSQSASDSASSAGLAQAAPEGRASLPAGAITASNLDYDATSLREGPVAPLSADKSADASPAPSRNLAPSGDSALSAGGALGALARLRPQPALQSCLDAIAGENGAGPIVVQTVDYARFSGAAALIVKFTAANGRWAWVSGPECGLPDVGASTAYSVQVG